MSDEKTLSNTVERDGHIPVTEEAAKVDEAIPSKDAAEYDPANEEPADYGELDYDYTSISDKIAGGTRAKERGNAQYRLGNYEKAWKEYDRAFVHIYTSKEEWEAIGDQWRRAINEFKLPCHLNRGLCRLKKDDLENALWDFSESLRIDENSAKARYRRGVTLTRMVLADLEKEVKKETWNLDKAQERADLAKEDLMKAVKLKPNDKAIRDAIEDVKAVRIRLRGVQRSYEREQKKLFTGLIANLDESNRRKELEEEKQIFKDMPPLERVSISY